MIEAEPEAATGRAPGAPIIRLAALVTLALGLAAALLPLAKDLPGGALVGWLLLVAGGAEVAAAAVRPPGPVRGGAFAAGTATTAAGLLFVARPYVAFMPLGWLVMLWLLLRGALQIAGGLRATGALRTWTLFSGFADLLLGLILLAGLPIAALVAGMFGPTREVVASFSLVFAASFLVTAMALFAAARSPS